MREMKEILYKFRINHVWQIHWKYTKNIFKVVFLHQDKSDFAISCNISIFFKLFTWPCSTYIIRKCLFWFTVCQGILGHGPFKSLRHHCVKHALYSSMPYTLLRPGKIPIPLKTHCASPRFQRLHSFYFVCKAQM